MALKVFVADDDAGMRLVLRKIIDTLDGFEYLGEAADGKEAVRRCSELRPDVVFLDVEMPLLTGVEAAKEISDTLPEIAIIFATGHSEYMPDAFEVYAFDYLLKPFKVDRVRQTLRKLEKKLFRERVPVNPTLMIKSKESITLVPISDIVLAYRENRSTYIVSVDGIYPTSESLNEIWERINNGNFFRSHRAFIINVAAVSKIYPYGRWTYIVKLKGSDKEALITKERLAELQKHLV